MVKDLNYKEGAKNKSIALTGDQSTPDIMKRAITLMLFSKDPDIRNFNGTSIVNVFSTIPQSGFSGIAFYLALAAGRMLEILREIDSSVEDVYFTCNDAAPTLSVVLNIKLASSTITSVVYSE